MIRCVVFTYDSSVNHVYLRIDSKRNAPIISNALIRQHAPRSSDPKELDAVVWVVDGLKFGSCKAVYIQRAGVYLTS